MNEQILADPGGAYMRGFTARPVQPQNALASVPAPAPGYNALAAHGGPTKAAANAMGQNNKTPDALSVAAKAVGLNETGQKAALQEFLRNGGQNLDPAVTAWCAAFVDATLQQAGSKGTGKLNARSYMDWGQPVDQPAPGDIAVFSRGDPNGWQGHVGFYQGTNPDGTFNILGGNQDNAVSVKPYSANRLLGFRRG